MKASAEQPDTAPFASAAMEYLDKGWQGVLPLPPRQKASPPDGYTGWEGDWPSYADVFAWTEEKPRHNVGLRMPDGVLGIDVDNYKEKHGGFTLAQKEEAWGPLPPTWRSTSRDDGISGIRLYAVPPGLGWVGGLPSIELIHLGHRYAVVAPSIHPEGRAYRWISPDGLTSTVTPSVSDLPRLPAEWIVGLSTGVHVAQARADLDSTAVNAWVDTLAGSHAAPCEFLTKRAISAASAVRNAEASRHDTTRDQVLALVRFAEQGHTGIIEALEKVRASFIAAVSADASRTFRESSSEWRRILDGAVRIVVANPEITMIEGDPCPPVLPRLAIPPRQPRPAVSNRVPDLEDTVSPQVSDSPPGTVSDHVLTVSEATEAQLLALLAPPAALVGPPSVPAPEPGRDRTSWWPADLSDVVSGKLSDEPPTFLRRMDSVACFYRGRVNGVIGASESGKTWLVLLACVQAINTHCQILYLDFEDSAIGIVERLRALGCDDEDILSYFHYVNPEESLAGFGHTDLQEAMVTYRPDMVVVDGVNAAMSLLGKDLMSNKDATEFSQLVLRPLASDGAAVVYVDHLPKNNNADSQGGIGAQAKRAMTTGCCLRVDATTPFGRGQRGELRITVDKDRVGFVRGNCHLVEGTSVFGTAVVTSNAATNMVSIAIKPPSGGTGRGAAVVRRLTGLMETISRYLEEAPAAVTQATIFRDVTGNQNSKKVALDTLLEEGYIRRTQTTTGYRFTSGRIYREALDPVAVDLSADPFGSSYPLVQDQEEGTVSTVSNRVQTVSETRPVDRVSVSPPPVGDTDTVRDQDKIQNAPPCPDLEDSPADTVESAEPQRPHQLVHEHVTINEAGEFVDLDTGEVIDPDELDRDV